MPILSNVNLLIKIFYSRYVFDYFPLLNLPESYLNLLLLQDKSLETLCSYMVENKKSINKKCGICIICGSIFCTCKLCNLNSDAMYEHNKNCPGICSIILLISDCTIKFIYDEKESKINGVPYIDFKGQSGTFLRHYFVIFFIFIEPVEI